MTDTRTLSDLAAAVIDANRTAGRTVVTAESCTGGMVAAALTDVAGSSDVFVEGFVTYADAAKVRSLGVSRDILDTFGAVSLACAWAMVEGALERSGANVAVAITGIAGPGRGSDRKPVGLVAFSRGRKGQNPETYFTQRVQFDSTDRAAIRLAATRRALELLHPDADGLAPGDDVTLPAP